MIFTRYDHWGGQLIGEDIYVIPKSYSNIPQSCSLDEPGRSSEALALRLWALSGFPSPFAIALCTLVRDPDPGLSSRVWLLKHSLKQLVSLPTGLIHSCHHKPSTMPEQDRVPENIWRWHRDFQSGVHKHLGRKMCNMCAYIFLET